jgi:hypothetical protein
MGGCVLHSGAYGYDVEVLYECMTSCSICSEMLRVVIRLLDRFLSGQTGTKGRCYFVFRVEI